MTAMRKLGLRFGALILMVGATLMVCGAPVHARRSTASIFAAVDTSKDGTVDGAELDRPRLHCSTGSITIRMALSMRTSCGVISARKSSKATTQIATAP